MAGICIITGVHLCVLCLPAAEVSWISCGGWAPSWEWSGRARALGIKYQPRRGPPFLAVGWEDCFGPCSPQTRKKIPAAIRRHSDEHSTCVVAFDPISFEEVGIIFPIFTEEETAAQKSKSFAKAANGPRSFPPQWAAFHFSGASFSTKDLACKHSSQSWGHEIRW